MDHRQQAQKRPWLQLSKSCLSLSLSLHLFFPCLPFYCLLVERLEKNILTKIPFWRGQTWPIKLMLFFVCFVFWFLTASHLAQGEPIVFQDNRHKKPPKIEDSLGQSEEKGESDHQTRSSKNHLGLFISMCTLQQSVLQESQWATWGPS